MNTFVKVFGKTKWQNTTNSQRLGSGLRLADSIARANPAVVLRRAVLQGEWAKTTTVVKTGTRWNWRARYLFIRAAFPLQSHWPPLDIMFSGRRNRVTMVNVCLMFYWYALGRWNIWLIRAGDVYRVCPSVFYGFLFSRYGGTIWWCPKIFQPKNILSENELTKIILSEKYLNGNAL